MNSNGGSGGLHEMFPENKNDNEHQDSSVLIKNFEENENPNRSDENIDTKKEDEPFRRNSNEDHENKISDISFPMKNDFIEFGDDESNPNSTKNINPLDKTSEEKIDFNLTKPLDTEDLQPAKVNPSDEYGKPNSKQIIIN